MSVKRKIQKLERRCFTEREQIFEAFFKEFFSWSAGNIGTWIAAGFFEFFLGIFMWIPYQDMQDMGLLGMISLLAVWGGMFYVFPYLQFQEGIQATRKTVRVYEKLQYLPISLKELQIYRTKKLALFCIKMFLIFLVGQLFFAVVVCHQFTLGNILYVVICGFVIPFGVNGMTARFSK